MKRNTRYNYRNLRKILDSLSPQQWSLFGLCTSELSISVAAKQPNQHKYHFTRYTFTQTWSTQLKIYTFTNMKYHSHHNRFTALFLGPPGWAGARRKLLDFMVQGKINKGRHTDHPAERHSIGTNQCVPPPPSHIFYRPDALPAAQPTASKHWRQLAHSD